MRLCIFCGSASGRQRYVEAAQHVGRTLAEKGIDLVYGGGGVGTMGVLADAALKAGGSVIGVIPQGLADLELAHAGLTELQVVATMHERKARMADLADGFLALPGGAGTLEELCEVWTWGQLDLHAKPIGLLDVAGYFEHLERLLDHMVTEGFLSSSWRQTLIVESDLHLWLDRATNYQPPLRS